jgi:hypothetical protein
VHIARLLKIDPTTSIEKTEEGLNNEVGEESVHKDIKQWPRKVNAWLLSSRNSVESRDLRRHIDWLLAKIGPALAEIHSLQEQGCTTRVFCYWASKEGQGGPIISYREMGDLSDLHMDLELDIYGI